VKETLLPASIVLFITSSSSTLIDPILVNNYDIVRDGYVLPNFCSDYCPSIIEINFSVTREKSYLKTIWDYDNANNIAILASLIISIISLRILRKCSQSLARFRNFAFLCTRFLFLIYILNLIFLMYPTCTL
jgi:hypothetical protein